jgi:hypothetical protein
MTTTMKQGIYRELIQDGEEFFDEPITKTLRAAVIPPGNLDNIILCFRP